MICLEIFPFINWMKILGSGNLHDSDCKADTIDLTSGINENRLREIVKDNNFGIEHRYLAGFEIIPMNNYLCSMNFIYEKSIFPISFNVFLDIHNFLIL